MSRRKPDPVTGEPQLTYRERVFINEYIKNGGNGKLAAIAAGYGAARADQSAYQVLHRIQVQRQIQDRISESDVCAEEIVGTLASFMRGNIAMLLDEHGNFDMDLVKERRLGHLLKTVTRTTREIKTQPGQPPQVTQDYRIQLHSPVQAASVLARLLGLNRRSSDFMSDDSDIAPADSPLPQNLPDDLPDDIPDDIPDDLPDDLRANHYSEPPDPAGQPGLHELLDPALWMEALIKLEMERQGLTRSEVIEIILQLRPDAAEFIRPQPGAHDHPSTTPAEILSTIDRAVDDSEILEDDISLPPLGDAQTLSLEDLERIAVVVKNLRKLNATQCLDDQVSSPQEINISDGSPPEAVAGT